MREDVKDLVQLAESLPSSLHTQKLNLELLTTEINEHLDETFRLVCRKRS